MYPCCSEYSVLSSILPHTLPPLSHFCSCTVLPRLLSTCGPATAPVKVCCAATADAQGAEGVVCLSSSICYWSISIPAVLSSCRALSTTVLRWCACLFAGVAISPSLSILPNRLHPVKFSPTHTTLAQPCHIIGRQHRAYGGTQAKTTQSVEVSKHRQRNSI